MSKNIFSTSKRIELLFSLIFITLTVAFGFLLTQPDDAFAAILPVASAPADSDFHTLGPYKTQSTAKVPSVKISVVPKPSSFAAKFAPSSSKHPCVALPPGSGSNAPVTTPSKSVTNKVGAIKQQIQNLNAYITQHTKSVSTKKIGAIKQQVQNLQAQITKLLQQSGTPTKSIANPCPTPTPTPTPKVVAPVVAPGAPGSSPVVPPGAPTQECLINSDCLNIQGTPTTTACTTAKGAAGFMCTLHYCAVPRMCMTDAACGVLPGGIPGGVTAHCGVFASHTSCCNLPQTPPSQSQECLLDSRCTAIQGTPTTIACGAPVNGVAQHMCNLHSCNVAKETCIKDAECGVVHGGVGAHCGVSASGTSCCNLSNATNPAPPPPPVVAPHQCTPGTQKCMPDATCRGTSPQTALGTVGPNCGVGVSCCNLKTPVNSSPVKNPQPAGTQCSQQGGQCMSGGSCLNLGKQVSGSVDCTAPNICCKPKAAAIVQPPVGPPAPPPACSTIQTVGLTYSCITGNGVTSPQTLCAQSGSGGKIVNATCSSGGVCCSVVRGSCQYNDWLGNHKGTCQNSCPNLFLNKGSSPDCTGGQVCCS